MVLSASTASGLIKKLLLCLANRQLVEVWRAGRPLGGWAAEGSESVSRYLVAAAPHHIRSAWSPDWAEDEGAIQWLSDFVDGRQDAIPVHTARALGAVRVAQLAKSAVCFCCFLCPCVAVLLCVSHPCLSVCRLSAYLCVFLTSSVPPGICEQLVVGIGSLVGAGTG